MLRLAFIVLFLILTVALPFAIWGERLEVGFTADGALRWLQGYGAVAWAAAIVLMIADLALPIPESGVMGALGMIYGVALGGLIATAGAVAGGLAGYGLCRWFGRPLARWLIGAAALEKGDAIFLDRGGWIVAMSRWIPVMAEVVVCLAGLAAMPFATFALALVCGSLPIGFVYAAIGHFGADRPVLALALCILLPAVLWLLARALAWTPLLTGRRGGIGR